ncbi:RNA polymerase sigma factor [Sphingomonas lycopersici]|uniref:Sigma-70 family RNA polymerase sigma factor n=1 Tax=Sphingomonas lycopersici TaxID=2951807 RepID=A0AA41ZC25_9SPHN|nr:sigma-70 family RNA polymerase sigma factor [Sphingomonas lycopersici]MCW6536924.1 sigma-70 family RNA polymerase sigma factor [Sphingomonas lycopersici]
MSSEDEQQGDLDAPLPDRKIDRLFRVEAPRLARFIRRSIRNNDEVNDLVQETFANFVAAAPRVRPRTPEAYLRTIARHLMWRLSQRRWRHREVQFVPVDEAADVSVAPEQEWMMEASDIIRQYEQALIELPARTREVFRLSRQEGLTYPEIAERLGLSVRGVKYHMKKALLYLDYRVKADG